MPRSGEQARIRLRQAALELYQERGYDATTTAAIAERAGVTERTYFRHFADKREVLFDSEQELTDDLVRGVTEAPSGLDALTALARGFAAAAPLLERNRGLAGVRAQIVEATPALRERALAKEASLTAALAAAVERRGVASEDAESAAQIGMIGFNRAFRLWFTDPGTPFETYLAQVFDRIRSIAAAV